MAACCFDGKICLGRTRFGQAPLVGFSILFGEELHVFSTTDEITISPVENENHVPTHFTFVDLSGVCHELLLLTFND
jgi:hypothetical protein